MSNSVLGFVWNVLIRSGPLSVSVFEGNGPFELVKLALMSEALSISCTIL